MNIPKELTTVTPLSKALAVILFITLPFIGFFLGVKYQSSLNTPKVETIPLPISSLEIKPTITESYCAKAGETPVSNFDMTTGKINPNIKIKNCCLGLKNIAEKQSTINRDRDVCGQSIGASDSICSPCGNSICDSQYEDYCNCPEDCK